MFQRLEVAVSQVVVYHNVDTIQRQTIVRQANTHVYVYVVALRVMWLQVPICHLAQLFAGAAFGARHHHRTCARGLGIRDVHDCQRVTRQHRPVHGRSSVQGEAASAHAAAAC